MIHHIDVHTVLQRCVCDLYSNLVTRPTGVAVRTGIEQLLAAAPRQPTLTVIDFSNVGLLDYSCADEIVAKLLLQYVSVDTPRREVYFVFRGISDSHLDAIEAVLERHQLALVSQFADGAPRLIGTVGGNERKTWEAISELGAGGAADVAGASGISSDDAALMLDTLWRRRLVIRYEDGYAAVGAATETMIPLRMGA